MGRNVQLFFMKVLSKEPYGFMLYLHVIFLNLLLLFLASALSVSQPNNIEILMKHTFMILCLVESLDALKPVLRGID
jgi:hypothetical protein